jgi:hypothetical protein
MRLISCTAVAVLVCLGLAAPSVAQQWIEYCPADRSYRVEFPGQPIEKVKDIKSGYGPVQNHNTQLDVDPGLAYLVSYTDYPQVMLSTPVETTLDQLRTGAVG